MLSLFAAVRGRAQEAFSRQQQTVAVQLAGHAEEAGSRFSLHLAMLIPAVAGEAGGNVDSAPFDLLCKVLYEIAMSFSKQLCEKLCVMIDGLLAKGMASSAVETVGRGVNSCACGLVTPFYS